MTPSRVNRRRSLTRPSFSTQLRTGFTLVELLVSITIFVVLATVSLSAFKTSPRDKVNSGARQIQAVFNGAKSRAAKAGEPRGVRFVLDPVNRHVVSALQYVGPGGYHTGTVRVQIAPSDREPIAPNALRPICRIVCNEGGEWDSLFNEGLLNANAQIRIPADHTGRWYSITITDFANGIASLHQVPVGAEWDPDPSWDTAVFPSPAATPTYQFRPRGSRIVGTPANPRSSPAPAGGPYQYSNSTPIPYLLRLSSQPLPNTTPINLPAGIVIDLDGCQVPAGWRLREDTNNDGTLDPGEDINGNGRLDLAGAYAPDFPDAAGPHELDLMFAPNGTSYGDTSTYGPLYFTIAHIDDAELADTVRAINGITTNFPYMVPGDYDISYGDIADYPSKERKVVGFYPMTGTVLIAEVNGFDLPPPPAMPNDNNKLADNPFSYAISGKETP